MVITTINMMKLAHFRLSVRSEPGQCQCCPCTKVRRSDEGTCQEGDALNDRTAAFDLNGSPHPL